MVARRTVVGKETPAGRLHHSLVPSTGNHSVHIPHSFRSLPAVRVCDSRGELRRKGSSILHRLWGGIHDLEPACEAPSRRASGTLLSSHERSREGENEVGSATRIQE